MIEFIINVRERGIISPCFRSNLLFPWHEKSIESPTIATYDARNQIRRENEMKIGAKAANS